MYSLRRRKLGAHVITQQEFPALYVHKRINSSAETNRELEENIRYKMHGKYHHNLLAHATFKYRIISGKSPHVEDEEQAISEDVM